MAGGLHQTRNCVLIGQGVGDTFFDFNLFSTLVSLPYPLYPSDKDATSSLMQTPCKLPSITTFHFTHSNTLLLCRRGVSVDSRNARYLSLRRERATSQTPWGMRPVIPLSVVEAVRTYVRGKKEGVRSTEFCFRRVDEGRQSFWS